MYLLTQKSDTFEVYLGFEAWDSMQHGAKILRLHSDQGGKYLSGVFNTHLEKQGMEHL